MIALDASALLAFLFQEPGHERVASALDSACLSTVNLSEVVGRFVRDGHDGGQVMARLTRSPIEIVPFDAEQARIAAGLLPATRSHGLSLADRACLALALTRGVPVLSADRVWGEIEEGVEVRLIR